jgi:diguanylate cyclase (GGDEF)-like protein
LSSPAPLRVTGRRERAAAIALTALVIAVEAMLLLTFVRGSQANAEIGGTSHFVTTLANVQREVLKLQLTVARVAEDVDGDDHPQDIVTQRAILESQLRTLNGGVGDSPEAQLAYDTIVEQLAPVDAAMTSFLGGAPSTAAALNEAVVELERTVKRTYDRYEFGYFRRTSDTLAAQAATHLLMLVVAILIAVLGGALGFVLRRRVRSEFAHAYYRLEAEVRQRTEAQEMLLHQASHDALSGLPNRVAFGERLEAALASDRHGVAVLFVDLDDFKAINDALGHAAGDEVLQITASRLKGALREGDLAARLGGDEFAVLVAVSHDVREAAAVADRILEALHEPIQVAGRTLFVQASVGIAMAGSGDDDASEVMRNADIAMYLAKGQGKDRSQVYQPAMHADVLQRLALRADLEAAVNGDGLVLHYQPIVDLESNRVTAVEALVRWVHPERGLIPPNDFIPLAETTGLIVPLGRWVLREACRQVGVWRRELGNDLNVSINVSPVQLKHPGLIDDVRDAIDAAGLEPSDVVIEVTETGVVEKGAASEVLFALRALGLRIAMDDFGTGYSSLGQIGRLPIDIIKIDRTFVQSYGIASTETALTASIVRLASSLNMVTVAEGIENTTQLANIRALGCEAAQGFLMSKPMDASAASLFLVEHSGKPPVSWNAAPDRFGDRRPGGSQSTRASRPRPAMAAEAAR